ncbi:EamA family transporter [Thermodesulfobacteriota bacterium]
MSGILFLVLSVIFSSGVAISMKVANARKLRLGQFLAVNYIVCLLALLVWSAWQTPGRNSVFIWFLGIFIGVMYVISLWLFNRSISATGLALSTTLMRLSSALPTLGSLILFAEHTNLYQVLGLILAFACLPLASKEPIRFGQTGKEVWKGMLWGLLLFAVYGMTDFTFKIQAELEPLTNPGGFMATIFGTALLLTFPQLFKGTRPSKQCLFWGVVLGTMNVLTTYFWIRTLAHLPGSVAYPSLGLGVIAITTLASLLIWREKLRPANFAFLFLASVSVILINLG